MNINVEFNGVFLGAKKNETKNGVYFNVSVECDGDCCSLPCTEEVYKSVGAVDKYTPKLFDAVYNTNYKNIRVVGLA